MDLPKIEDLIKDADPEYLRELGRSLLRHGVAPIPSSIIILRDQRGNIHYAREVSVLVDRNQKHLKLLIQGRIYVILENTNQAFLKKAREYVLECLFQGTFIDLLDWKPPDLWEHPDA